MRPIYATSHHGLYDGQPALSSGFLSDFASKISYRQKIRTLSVSTMSRISLPAGRLGPGGMDSCRADGIPTLRLD